MKPFLAGCVLTALLFFVAPLACPAPPAGPSRDSTALTTMAHRLGAAETREAAALLRIEAMEAAADTLEAGIDTVWRQVVTYKPLGDGALSQSLLGRAEYWERRARAAEAVIEVAAHAAPKDSALHQTFRSTIDSAKRSAARLRVDLALSRDTINWAAVRIGELEADTRDLARRSGVGLLIGAAAIVPLGEKRICIGPGAVAGLRHRVAWKVEAGAGYGVAVCEGEVQHGPGATLGIRLPI